MARAAKRKKQTSSASQMADMRDTVMERGMFFKENADLMAIRGPGSGKPDEEIVVHYINMNDNDMKLLSSFIYTFVTVMYGDLVAPGHQTPGKLEDWKQIARDIALDAKEEDKEGTQKVFLRLSRQMDLCRKRVEDLIFYGASHEELRYALYDVVLKMSMEHNMDIKGFIPDF